LCDCTHIVNAKRFPNDNQRWNTFPPGLGHLFASLLTWAPPQAAAEHPKKRKAPLPPEAWEGVKASIYTLYIEKNGTLQDVKEAMEKDYGFSAT